MAAERRTVALVLCIDVCVAASIAAVSVLCLAEHVLCDGQLVLEPMPVRWGIFDWNVRLECSIGTFDRVLAHLLLAIESP